MLNRSFFTISILAGLSVITACQLQKKAVRDSPAKVSSALESGFRTPPDSIQTSVYWYWMSDNISKEGVVKDLQAMKRAGINRAFIGNIGYPATPYGQVKILSEAWWEILHTALKTAAELNIEIGIFNSPGWSQSGGPWIKPEQSMRYLTSSEQMVTGPKKLRINLAQPVSQFQDVRVIAFRVPKEYNTDLADLHPVLKASVPLEPLSVLVDKNKATELVISTPEPVMIDFELKRNFTARSLVIYPGAHQMTANVELQVKSQGIYRSVKKFRVDRSNGNLNVGFLPHGAVAVSIPATVSEHFRLIFSNGSEGFSVAEIELSSSPKIESYIEKTLAKMFQSPLPYWNEYQWPVQPAVADQGLLIDPDGIRDISACMAPDGTLNWDVPAGQWMVMRMGMTSTGVTNGPASPEATGLEVDKMSRKHVASHFELYLGEIIRRVPAEDRKTWKVSVQDSYETGGQNWTDSLIEKFQRQYGYDPLKYLPALNGRVVGSPERSDRFLWDLRRFIADRVAYDYVGGLREISHKYGLHTWLENYGHWGFPGEFLQYGGQSDEIGGEFWSEGDLGNIENRAASSAAHIYGKRKVSAESFTAGMSAYVRYPGMIKQRGDRFFTEGINNTLLHVFIEQPDERVPGVNANFGTEFNRHNTWFNYLDLFTSYLKRCNFMLQQGNYAADVAYFIGEDAPKMTGVCDPALPAGYSFDYINAEVIQQRMTVKEGRLMLPDGMSYRLLVLPKLETMRPELLQQIAKLVEQGATILGPAPLRSPGLAGYPEADMKVRQLASLLWGDVNGTTIRAHRFGKGTVLSGMDMQTALDYVHVVPDFKLGADEPVLYIHRVLKEEDVYFISNQSAQKISLSPEFRVSGKVPELWDPVTGATRKLPQYTSGDSTIRVDLKLDVLQSAFIVFRKPAPGVEVLSANFPEEKILPVITRLWEVSFDAAMRGPEKPVVFTELVDWTKRAEDSIRYYSGTAVYRNTFKGIKVLKGTRVYLNLGDVKVIARVKLNGKDVGGAWTAPWRVDITDALLRGLNKLEISVANTWVNRLIGDSKLPLAARKTWTSDNPYKPESSLEPAGLKGPVTLSIISY